MACNSGLMSMRSQHHCTQKLMSGLTAAILLAGVASMGCAFLLTVRVPVAIADRDAWTRRPDRWLGNVFLRRLPGTDEVVALRSVTRYGSTIEYDRDTRQFHDRRCWGFHFGMDGKCGEANPHSDLLKLDVQIRDGKVYVNWEFPR